MYTPGIPLPDRFAFRTDLQVYIHDLAGGLHVGNHVLVSYLNEAQMRLLTALGFPSLLVDDAITFNNEMVVQYRREVRYGDTVTVEAHIDTLDARSYRITCHMHNQHGQTILLAQLGMVFVDKTSGRRVDVPPAFEAAWQGFCAA